MPICPVKLHKHLQLDSRNPNQQTPLCIISKQRQLEGHFLQRISESNRIKRTKKEKEKEPTASTLTSMINDVSIMPPFSPFPFHLLFRTRAGRRRTRSQASVHSITDMNTLVIPAS